MASSCTMLRTRSASVGPMRCARPRSRSCAGNEMETVRLFRFALADGPTNMAVDETLLEAAAAGTASLRFYGWSAATLSLGYFQRAADRLVALPWVRRPSGGGAIVHHLEVTYCLALPAGRPWQSGESWLPRVHTLI